VNKWKSASALLEIIWRNNSTSKASHTLLLCNLIAMAKAIELKSNIISLMPGISERRMNMKEHMMIEEHITMIQSLKPLLRMNSAKYPAEKNMLAVNGSRILTDCRIEICTSS
jgi:hypothetical protein